jgi:ketosteroid isomerase-like protein
VGQDNIELLRTLYEHWERGDFAATAEFFDSEVEFTRTGSELTAGEWRGFDEMRATFAEYMQAWEDLQSKAERFIDLGDDRVLVLERQTARGKTSGVVVENELGWLFTLRDGKIVRLEGYWHRAEAMRAAGLER